MKRITALLIAIAMTTATSQAVLGDVSGSFNFDLTMSPQGTQTEAVKFDFDLFSNLQFVSTFSGVRVGADLGFGATGVEFAILKLGFNLGAVSVFDENVFATPFGCTQFVGALSESASNFDGQCRGKFVVPIGDINHDNRADPNAIAFVKKRTLLEINIGGVTLSNLVLFEDVDFPDIQGGGDHEHDHFDGMQMYNVLSVNGHVDDQTPSFVFGNMISFSGQTVSGISVRSETAICAEGRNYIKRRTWDIEVSKRCFDFDLPFALEGGGTPLLVDEQRLWLEGLGGELFSVDFFVRLNPTERSFNGTVTVRSIIAELAELEVLTLGGSSGIERITARLTAPNFTLIALDFGGDLSLDAFTGIFNLYVGAGRNGLIDSQLRVEADTNGFRDLFLTLGFSTLDYIVNTTTRFSSDGTGGLGWASTGFGMSTSTLGLEFGADFSFSQRGISDLHAAIGISF